MGSNGLTDENMKSIDDIFLKDYLLNACENKLNDDRIAGNGFWLFCHFLFSQESGGR